MAKRSTETILRDFRQLLDDSEPERVYADGEASRAQVRATTRKLARRKAALVKEFGRVPADAEIWAQ